MSRKKIALVGFKLSGGGGGRVMANLSNFFYEKGLEVHIIIFHDELGFSHSGKVFNLGKLKSKSNTIFNKVKRFYHFNKYIKKHNFDFIVDFRFRINIIQELLISKLVYNTNTIYTVHSSKLDVYLPSFTPLTKLMYGNSYKVISITKSMQNLIEEKHSLNNVQTIYNPINIERIKKYANKKPTLDFKYIIGVGEYYTNIKQFDILIKTYAESILIKKEIHLVILGTGKNKEYLLSIAKEYNIEQFVHLLGFKSNPYKYMKQAKFLVMSSLYEGFGMVIIEALASGTPVISFDCPTGPNEIIAHKENGLLVEDQNSEKLKNAINRFIEDENLYIDCKRNALASVSKFDIEIIGKQWLDLMKIDCVEIKN